MEVDRKAVETITAEIKTAKAADGTYDFTLSIPNLDRDKEIVDAKALEWRTPGRMPIDVDHGMTVLTTVGSGIPVYEGDVLKLSDFRFAKTALAQDVKSLVDDGHISKASVAFMDARRENDEKDGRVHIRSAELLNAAIVAIPSLREAEVSLAKSVIDHLRSASPDKTADLNQLQQIHDLVAESGAACKACVHVDDTEKSTDADPDDQAAAPAAADRPAEVFVALAEAHSAMAEVHLLTS